MTTTDTNQETKKRNIFSRIASLFCSHKPQSDLPHAARSVLIELRHSEWHELSQKPLSDEIKLLRLLQYQLQIKELQQDIPAGYIGRATFLEAGQLKSQELYRIQSKLVVEKSLLRHRIPLSTAPEQCLVNQDNTCYSFHNDFKNQR